MEAKIRLAAWLHSAKREYNEGLKLFRELNVNPDMTKFFGEPKPGKIHQSLLLRQLSEYARLHNIKPMPLPVQIAIAPKPVVQRKNVVASTTRNRVKIDKNPTVRYEDLPVQFQVMYDECGRLSAEMKSMHAQLKALRHSGIKSAERAELAKGLVSRAKTVRSNWSQIDDWWKENQSIEDPVVIAAQQAIEKDRRIKANLNYIRRYYKDPSKAEEVKIRTAELDKWNVPYEELIRKISGTH